MDIPYCKIPSIGDSIYRITAGNVIDVETTGKVAVISSTDILKDLNSGNILPCNSAGMLLNTQTKRKSDNQEWTDKHYDFWYTLTPEDIKEGKIKIDPYWVSNHWKLGEKDNSGALFHILKTLARWGYKNDVIREANAVFNQIKGYARVFKITLK